MNFDINKENVHAKISDTDSIIIGLEDVLKKLYPDLDIFNTEEILPKVKEIQKELQPLLNNYQTVLAKRILNSDEHFFDFKPEFIFKSAYISGKRRYALNMVDREGMSVDKNVMMGLDIMKSSFPKHFNTFGTELISKVLNSTNRKEVDKFIIDFKNSIYEVPWINLCKPTGIKKISEYIESKPPEGKIFSTLKKKCPANTKGAIRYNNLIQFKKLEQQYSQIQIGDKILLVYLKKNPYQLDMIAIKNNENPQFIMDLVEEYIDKDKLFETILQNKIDKVYEDLGYGVVIYNSNITDFFSFN